MKKLICVFVLLIAGCSGDPEIFKLSDPEMQKRFGSNKPHLFTEDKTGDKFIVKHHLGNTYTVELLARKNK